MACACCGSSNQAEFPSEIAIHFPGRENRNKPHVFVFSAVLVCLDCGFSAFNIAEPELGRLGGTMARDESLPPKDTPLSGISER
jgi:hypothetical protein